jgi:16S rRNA (guanine527-N7)-methyltransferase
LNASPVAEPELPEAGREAMRSVLALLAEDRGAPSSVTEPRRAWRVHVADSLTGLEVGGLSVAERIADLGSGAGFPGLALAAALADAEVWLVESVGRKCDFIRRAIERAGIPNARVVCDRAESWGEREPPGGGREAHQAVTARAVGRLSTVAELASPLLVEGGVLVAWKGRRRPDEELELERAAPQLAMDPVDILRVGPYAGSTNRHLHVIRKTGPTPRSLPRRPGMAKKRPYGGGRRPEGPVGAAR